MVRLAGLEPARLSPLPPQSSVSANSTISATVDNQALTHPKIKPNAPLLTAVLTVTQKRRNSKRFLRVGNGSAHKHKVRYGAAYQETPKIALSSKDGKRSLQKSEQAVAHMVELADTLL